MRGTTVTREAQFDMGHRLVGYKGPCGRLHGHRYRLLVTVAGEVDGQGMVIDFVRLKAEIASVVALMDHRMMLQDTDPLVVLGGSLDAERDGVLVVPFAPTAENIAAWTFDQLRVAVTPLVTRVQLYETPGSVAEVVA